MTEKQAWIIVADTTNMETCAKLGMYGLNDPSQLSKMQIEDKLAIYVSKETTSSGIKEVTKEYHTNKKDMFDDGLFSNRVGIKLDLLPESKAVNAWSLTDELEFSRGKLHWQGALAGGVRKILLTNYKMIADALSQEMARRDKEECQH